MSSWKFNASLTGRPALDQNPPSPAPRGHVVTVPSSVSSDFSERSAPSVLPRTQQARESSSLTPFQRPSPFAARRQAGTHLPVPSFVNASEVSEAPASELPLRPLRESSIVSARSPDAMDSTGVERSRPRNVTNSPRNQAADVARSVRRVQQRATGNAPLTGLTADQTSFSSRETVEAIRANACTLIQQGSLEQAEVEFRRLVVADPQNPGDRDRLVDCLMAQQRWAEAELHARRAFALVNPGTRKSKYAHKCSSALIHQGKFKEAVPFLREYVKLGKSARAPKEEQAARCLELAMLILDNKLSEHTPEALQNLEQVLKLNPAAVNAAVTLRTQLGKNGVGATWLRRALAAQRSLLAVRPNSATYNYEHGLLLLQTTSWREAIPYLQRAVTAAEAVEANHGQRARCYLSLAECLHRSERFDEAKPYYKLAIASFDKDSAHSSWRSGLSRAKALKKLCSEKTLVQSKANKVASGFNTAGMAAQTVLGALMSPSSAQIPEVTLFGASSSHRYSLSYPPWM